MSTVIGPSSLITFDSTGLGTQYTEPADIVREKIKFLLLTNKGEIPLEPEYGADLRNFAFRPVDDMLIQAMENIIRMELATWMPYVNVDHIELNQPQDGLLLLGLYYALQEGYEDWLSVIIPGV